MNVIQLKEKINKVLNKKGFTVINGRFCSDKTWLINNLGKEIFLLNKGVQALNDET